MQKLFRFFLPRIEYILLLAVFWGTVASGPRILNFDGDLPRHILTGNLIIQTRHVATTDVFSFRTTGFPSFPHEWLSQVLLAGAHRWLGLDGIVLLTAMIVLLAWGINYRLAIRKSNSLLLALIMTVLGVGASQIHVLPRPHIFTYALVALWLLLLEEMKDNRTRFWWLFPVVMLLWVNMHGMFVLGMMILGIYVIGDFFDHPTRDWLANKKTKHLLLAGGLSLTATFASPSGPRIWEAITSLGSNAYITSKIPEYQSANFHLPGTWPFIILLLVTTIGLGRSTSKASWVHMLLVVTFAALAIYSSRMIPLFAIVVTPVATQVMANWLHTEYPRSRLWIFEENASRMNSMSNGLIWIFALVFLAAILLRSGARLAPEGRGNAFDPHFFPVKAVSWLEAHPQSGRMFNEFNWGGYLLLELWPDQQIFMDGHTHIYGEALTREYERVVTLAPGWEEILAKYAVDWVIVRSHAPLVDALFARGNWEIVYEDPTAVILIHR